MDGAVVGRNKNDAGREVKEQKDRRDELDVEEKHQQRDGEQRAAKAGDTFDEVPAEDDQASQKGDADFGRGHRESSFPVQCCSCFLQLPFHPQLFEYLDGFLQLLPPFLQPHC